MANTLDNTLKSFTWSGELKGVGKKSGEIRAKSAEHAIFILKKQGVKSPQVKVLTSSKLQLVIEKDLVSIVRQLSTMLKSGVSIAQAFDMMIKTQKNPVNKKLLADLRGDLEAGVSFSASLRKHPRQFDGLFCAIIEAGEVSGQLDAMVDRLATYKEKTMRLKARIKSAMTYPVVVILVALAVTTVIMVQVIPSFKKVFASFNAELPVPTQVVIAMSDFMTQYWFYLFGALGGGVYFIVHTHRRSPRFKAKCDRLLLKFPIFGEIIRKAIIARWARTFGTLFAAGVPMVESLNTVAIVADNDVYVRATKQVQADISVGNKLANSMEQTGVFPMLTTQMVAVGEESGDLDSMLDRVATQMEAEVDEAVDTLSSLIEPFIMVFLGVVIGGLIISMYLPIFKMGSVV